MNDEKTAPEGTASAPTDETTTNHENRQGRASGGPDSIDLSEFADLEALPPLLGEAAPVPPQHDTEKPKKRGRGRPPLCDEERERRKQERKERQKQRAQDEAELLLTSAGAETIVGLLDTVRIIVSNGEAPETPELRKGTLAAWKRYLAETGGEIPPAYMVIFTSIAYTTPAFATPTARGRFSRFIANIKAWVVKRRA